MAENRPSTSMPHFPAKLPELIGQVTIAYNEVQFLWLLLFSEFLWGDRALARSMFQALRNDSSQRDIIAAAAEVTLSDNPKVLEETRRLMRVTNDLVAERNAAIHTFWDRELSTGRYVPTPSLRAHKKLQDDPISQFTEMRQKLDDVRSDMIALMAWVGVTLASHESYQTQLPPPFGS